MYFPGFYALSPHSIYYCCYMLLLLLLLFYGFFIFYLDVIGNVNHNKFATNVPYACVLLFELHSFHPFNPYRPLHTTHNFKNACKKLCSQLNPTISSFIPSTVYCCFTYVVREQLFFSRCI